ncbi:MAG: putative toxin-antitoxin system toxin component, PIN family [Prevotellaceae bacterium]|jgi:putative PIN family toxin of toxin-antitoxin system|nr:putative toxin-antitoxin system toxin component, PIN family [Prevotellaceae bacterium]
MKRKTVFDVNVWISYFISNKANLIMSMVDNNGVYLYCSNELMTELRDVINREKFAKYFPEGTEKYLLFCELITELYPTIPLFSDCPDPDDNYLFDLAYQANTEFLVSGDKKVLNTPVRKSLKLRNLADFKHEISTEI